VVEYSSSEKVDEEADDSVEMAAMVEEVATVLVGVASIEVVSSSSSSLSVETEPDPEPLEAPGATQLDPVNPAAAVGRLEA
jgi:hypothetical protein